MAEGESLSVSDQEDGNRVAADSEDGDDQIWQLMTILESEEPGTKLQELSEEGMIESLIPIPNQYLESQGLTAKSKDKIYSDILHAWQALDFLFTIDFDSKF